MFKFEFDQQTLQIINMGLGEIPHKLAGPVVENFNRQIAAQQKAEADALQAERDRNKPVVTDATPNPE